MANQESDPASGLAEWVAKSTRARALACILEQKARARPADRADLLELVRKLRVGASILERRVLIARPEDKGPSSSASSVSPSDVLPSAGRARL